MTAGSAEGPSRALAWAGAWIGVALAGFLDGILLHQVLQWHHMVSAVDDDPALNTLADGLFHAGAYAVAVIGLVQLWRARRDFGGQRRAQGFLGAVLIGAGTFNLLEGLINHHLLGIHHVRQGSPDELAWDLGFLAVSAIILAVGWHLLRAARTA